MMITAARTPSGDAGDIVLGWLTRVVVALALLGLVAFDGISIVSSRISLEDVGDQAARSASDTWERTHDIQAALKSAQDTATEANAETTVVPTSLSVDPDGTAHLTVTKVALTVVAHHIPALRGLYHLHVEGAGRSTT